MKLLILQFIIRFSYYFKVQDVVLVRLHNQTLSVFMLDTIQTVLLCLYVADPATFRASSSVLGPYFPLRAASLFNSGEKFVL